MEICHFICEVSLSQMYKNQEGQQGQGQVNFHELLIYPSKCSWQLSILLVDGTYRKHSAEIRRDKT